MNRQELAHILRAATQIAHDPDVLVLGSQAILGSYDEDELPAEATMSREADVAFLDDPTRSKADLVEGSIGEMSPFHKANTYYAEGIHVDTAVLLNDWRDRIHGCPLESSHPARVWFIEKHDLAVSKLMAGRHKDVSFVRALVQEGLIDPSVVNERLDDMPATAHPNAVARARRHMAAEGRKY